ncbi:tetratricopeptide repeat-containing sensor histidine kinase [Spirosoma sp.]|uniref:tetratricopeptide repeat-containing sensor histidine kinase n=1 Tax=Spirosoma sp. TaxID=1899569 RepID=UPI003B3B746F
MPLCGSRGVLLCLAWLFLFISYGKAQSSASREEVDRLLRSVTKTVTDTNKVRTLLRLSEFYLSSPIADKALSDSARHFTELAEMLSRTIHFNHGIDKSLYLKAIYQLEQQNNGEVARISQQLSDSSRIRLFLEQGKRLLRPTQLRYAKRDSAIYFFQKAERISQSIGHNLLAEESQNLIGVAYILEKDWPRARASFMKVIQARQTAGDRSGEVKVWLRMATTTYCDDCRENMKALEKGLTLARQIRSKALELLILLEMGFEHFQLDGGETWRADQRAAQALAIQNVIGFRALTAAYRNLAMSSVYNRPGEYGYLSNTNYFLSDLSQAKGDLNQKLFYILQVVKAEEKNGQSAELDYAYFRLGNAYFGLNQYEKSLMYYQKSLVISRQKSELTIQIGLITRMVITFLKLGKPQEALRFLQTISGKIKYVTYEDNILLNQSYGDCYSALKQYKKAEQYYLASVAWSKQVALQFQCSAWQRISQFYVDNAQFKKADPFLHHLLSISQKRIIPSQQLEIQLMRFKVDSAQGNYKAAINHYQTYKNLTDSIFNEKKSQQIARLTIEYETQKKEQTLALREKNIDLLTIQNRSHQTQRNALIVGSILLLALLGLSYNRYRLKQLNNKQLLDQQKILQTQHIELQARQKEINQKNSSLQQLLTEKEWLLKEIHHRVKNNLQVVMSLLNTQASYLVDNAAITAIRESQHRVQTMAMIHQKLYQSEGMARIDMGAFIQDVVVYLRNSYKLDQQHSFELNVESIDLEVTQAIPVGLIINEAITNSLKYAFPVDKSGTITITLRRIAELSCELIIADNGVGLPPGFDVSQSRSLGMTLIKGFSQQLDASLTITSETGVLISLIFTEEN